jgi:hypothetical protein
MRAALDPSLPSATYQIISGQINSYNIIEDRDKITIRNTPFTLDLLLLLPSASATYQLRSIKNIRAQ